MDGNIYLNGFMASGKTTTGRELAALWGRRFVDLDQWVERRLGMPIASAFAELGEEAFRRAESAELKRAAGRQRLVVACGGGLPQDPANRSLMRTSGRVVLLDAPLERCRARLTPRQRAARPMWADPAAVERLYRSRQEAYADCDARVAVDGQDPRGTALAVSLALLPDQAMEVHLGEGRHPLKAAWDAPAAVARACAGRRVALLCDSHLEQLHLGRYRQALDPALVLTVPAGEGSKTLARAKRLYSALARAGLDRGDVLVALGGGVVTDLGAFTAATFKRGMHLVLAATSLLACVDAAVGGKAAVNLGPHKNLVGSFVTPDAVVLDRAALATLPRRHRLEGWVEAYKTGLVADPGLALQAASERGPVLAGDLPAMARLAWASARAKAAVVADDFREAGRRRILNLGHTYGHVLEGASGYRLRHGLAVAAGMLVAAALSQGRNLLYPAEAEAMEAALRPLLPARLAWPEADAAWELLRNDKKNRGGKVVFVLLRGVGDAVWVDDVTPAELARAVARAKGARP